MKKIITLVFACLMITKVYAKDYYYAHYINLTQNIGGGGIGDQNLNVIANYGDSVAFIAYAGCGMFSVDPYQWYFEGDSIPNSSNQGYITVVINQSGSYRANLCYCGPLIDIFFNVTNITGITFIKNINFLNVYPTTVTSSITIQLNSIKTNDIEISFFDMNGRQLKNDFYKNISGEFIKNENTEALAKGIYFLRIKAGEDVVEKKFVKM